jgi:phosphate transport system permease protein
MSGTTANPAYMPAGNSGRDARAASRLRRIDRFGDGLLFGVCALASLLGAVVLLLVAYQMVHGASPSISKFGLGFLTQTTWQPNFNVYGAGTLIFGTVVSSFLALAIGGPIAVSIGLFLSLLAPRGVRGVISPLVEMLAAIPSVILGFWGILILAPFVQSDIEPWLHDTLGFIPLFGPPQTTGASVFTASLILTIMIIPIIASISRDLFLSVPHEMQDGASALGATRWEVVRGVVLPTTASGVTAASLLGLGRALGEAIAVTQVIGAGSTINANLFKTGDTLAARIANQFPGAITEMHIASLYYLGVILLVIGLLSNLLAQWIARRFDYSRSVTR